MVIRNYVKRAADAITSNITTFIAMTEGSHRTYIYTIKKNIFIRYKNEIEENYRPNDYILPRRHNSYKNQIIPIPKNKKLNWRLLHDIRDRVQDIADSTHIIYFKEGIHLCYHKYVDNNLQVTYYAHLFVLIY